MFSQYINSPLGPVKISATSGGICQVLFTDTIATAAPSALTALAAEQLQAYFAGTLQQFSLPLAASGTAFVRTTYMGTQVAESKTLASASQVRGGLRALLQHVAGAFVFGVVFGGFTAFVPFLGPPGLGAGPQTNVVRAFSISPRLSVMLSPCGSSSARVTVVSVEPVTVPVKRRPTGWFG